MRNIDCPSLYLSLVNTQNVQPSPPLLGAQTQNVQCLLSEEHGLYVQLARTAYVFHLVSVTGRTTSIIIPTESFSSVGTLAFGLGVVGIVIGCFTFVNAAWNVLVVCVHPGYFESEREKSEKEMREAMTAEAARIGVRYICSCSTTKS